MLTCAPGALVNKPNIVKYSCNLCNWPFINIKNTIFKAKVTYVLRVYPLSK
jgi:hypothetical protein